MNKKMHKGKLGKGASPKTLRGPFKQADTMADMPTMGNRGGGKKMAKAREKRLERASV